MNLRRVLGRFAVFFRHFRPVPIIRAVFRIVKK